MALWNRWMLVTCRLRPAFRRQRTFFWFLTALMAISIRADLSGVTSFVRSLGLHGGCYDALRWMFRSQAVDLEVLRKRWVQIAIDVFRDHLPRENGKILLVCDGIKVPKEGTHMPAVKSLHQESSNNSKPEYIMGHSWQVVSLLAGKASSFFAVPLAAVIGEGLVFSNRHHRTQLDVLSALLGRLSVRASFYLLADAYYACGKIIRPLLGRGCHLVSRVRITTVAHRPLTPAPNGVRRRGRPALYGEKVPLRSLFDDLRDKMISPYAREKDIILSYSCIDLLWRPVGAVVRFVAVEHPRLGRRIFLSTDISRDPADIIRMYSWRFKIEVSFRQAIRVLGTYAYRFWMKQMRPTRKGDGDQFLHRASDVYRSQVKRKTTAYELHVMIGLIAQGLLHFLACSASSSVWSSFRGWLRTMRPDLPPSELVTAQSLRDSLPDFLARSSEDASFVKFLADHVDPGHLHRLGLAA